MARDASIRRDTLPIDFPNDVSERVSVRIELIDRKCSREAVSLSVQRHVLADIGWAHKNSPGRIPAQRKGIQLVRGLPGLLPNSQAETARYWRPPGVHDFRPIAMPLGIGRVDHGTVRYSIGPFRHKLHLPHAYNRGIVVVIAGGDRRRCQPVCDRPQKRTLRRSWDRLLAHTCVRTAIGAGRLHENGRAYSESHCGGGCLQDTYCQVLPYHVSNLHLNSPLVDLWQIEKSNAHPDLPIAQLPELRECATPSHRRHSYVNAR